jgi:hypothetical protein
MVRRMKKHVYRADSSHPQYRKRVPADVQHRLFGRTIVLALPAVNGEPERLVTTTIGNEVIMRRRPPCGEILWRPAFCG